LVALGLCAALGILDNAGKVAGGVILAAFWIVGFIVMQRFIAIENRRPSLAESNIIGIKSVLYVFVPIFSTALLIALAIFLAKLVGIGGEAKQAGQAAQAADASGQNQNAIGALWGIFAMMFLLYIAPFVNLAVLSRLFSPKSKSV